MKTSKFAALFILLALAPVYASRGEATEPRALCQEMGSTPTDLAVRRFVSQPTNAGTAACLRLMARELEEGPVCVVEHLWYNTGDQGEAVMKLIYWPVCEPPLAVTSPADRPTGDLPAEAPSLLIPVEPDIRNFACLYDTVWLCLNEAADYLDEWRFRICGIEHVWVQPDSYNGNLAVVKLAFWPCPPPG